METCEPDSTTVVVDEPEEVVVVQEQTPLQARKRLIRERVLMCSLLVVTSVAERDRIHSKLQEARKKRERMMADIRLAINLCETAARSSTNVKSSVGEAIKKRLDLMKEIEAEKMWRPPSAEMSLKKQQELRERVEHMKAILGIGKICTPDE